MGRRPVLLFLFVLLSSARAYASPTGSIRGVVLEETTGVPMLLVTVVARSPSLTGPPRSEFTDDLGGFVIGDLPPGTYELLFVYGDIKRRRTHVVVAAGATTRVDILLPPGSEVITISHAPNAVDHRGPIAVRDIRSWHWRWLPSRERLLGELGERVLVDGMPLPDTAGLAFVSGFASELTRRRAWHDATIGRVEDQLAAVTTWTGSNETGGEIWGERGEGGFHIGGPLWKDHAWFHGGAVQRGGVTQGVGKLNVAFEYDHQLEASLVAEPAERLATARWTSKLRDHKAQLEGFFGWHEAASDSWLARAQGKKYWKLGGWHHTQLGAELERRAGADGWAAYLAEDWEPHRRVDVQAGVRVEGPGDVFVAPRVAAEATLGDFGESRVYAAWGRYRREHAAPGVDALVAGGEVEVPGIVTAVGAAFHHRHTATTDVAALELTLFRPAYRAWYLEAVYTFSWLDAERPHAMRLEGYRTFELGRADEVGLGVRLAAEGGGDPARFVGGARVTWRRQLGPHALYSYLEVLDVTGDLEARAGVALEL